MGFPGLPSKVMASSGPKALNSRGNEPYSPQDVLRRVVMDYSYVSSRAKSYFMLRLQHQAEFLEKSVFVVAD